jgi:hypothetical protein
MVPDSIPVEHPLRGRPAVWHDRTAHRVAYPVAAHFAQSHSHPSLAVSGFLEQLPNQAVEATAPRRFSFDGFWFHNIIVPSEAALPGAVPHLGRSACFGASFAMSDFAARGLGQ